MYVVIDINMNKTWPYQENVKKSRSFKLPKCES